MNGLGDGDKVGHEEEGKDIDRGLWAGNGGAVVDDDRLTHVDVMAAEGCVYKLEEVQGVWFGLLSVMSSMAGCGT